jgi:hypothetical protein
VALVDPRLVAGEVELRAADQEVRRAEAVERAEPRAARLEVGGELVDVRRARGDDPPAEDDPPSKARTNVSGAAA